MTSAKLLSAVEPVIRYQRGRFRGAESVREGSPRYDLGLQQREDATQRLIDVWASGEASAALGFTAARLFDQLEPLEQQINSRRAECGLHGSRAKVSAMRESEARALELLNGNLTDERRAELNTDPKVNFALLSAAANVLGPATKLWNTGEGTRMMREAVCLMGGYGVTEDCPGFLGNKWMDAQLEATYEGPEAVQRRQLTVTMTSALFLTQFRLWIKEMREFASEQPDPGACTLATAMTMWLWTLNYASHGKDADGRSLYQGQRQGVTFALADALCWLLAVRCQILDVRELEARGGDDPVVAEGLPATLQFFSDLCHVQSARAAGEVSRICTELVYGYNQHSASDPGFRQLQNELATSLTGSRLAKDRAAETVTKVMIPEALDYPQ
jgi:alkylation response protein AidB-like acyl-CoA dehydrogenase